MHHHHLLFLFAEPWLRLIVIYCQAYISFNIWRQFILCHYPQSPQPPRHSAVECSAQSLSHFMVIIAFICMPKLNGHSSSSTPAVPLPLHLMMFPYKYLQNTTIRPSINQTRRTIRGKLRFSSTTIVVRRILTNPYMEVRCYVILFELFLTHLHLLLWWTRTSISDFQF